MFPNTHHLSSHQVAPKPLKDSAALNATRSLTNEVLQRPVAALHDGNSRPVPLLPHLISTGHEGSELYLVPTAQLLVSCPVLPTNARVEDHPSPYREPLPGYLSIAQTTYTYINKLSNLVERETCDTSTPCQKLTTDHTACSATWPDTEPAGLGSVIEAGLLSLSGECGISNALCDNSKRKLSAVELFPRTNHQDKEECWDESGFLGLETDEKLLEEMGDELVNAKDQRQEEYSRGCTDPCWR